MKKYIGCDAHARYSVFVCVGEDGHWEAPVRVEHDRLEMERCLKRLPPGSPVALERSGNWYWLVQAMEEAGLEPRLAHALEAKKRMPGPPQDRPSGCQGLGADAAERALPEVWVPPAQRWICVT